MWPHNHCLYILLWEVCKSVVAKSKTLTEKELWLPKSLSARKVVKMMKLQDVSYLLINLNGDLQE